MSNKNPRNNPTDDFKGNMSLYPFNWRSAMLAIIVIAILAFVFWVFDAVFLK